MLRETSPKNHVNRGTLNFDFFFFFSFHCIILLIILFSGEVSIVTLAVLSFQRLLIITNPEKYKITSYKTSFLMNLGIWCYVLCMSIPPLFGFGKYVVESSGLT